MVAHHGWLRRQRDAAPQRRASSRAEHPLLQLQRTVGNAAVASLVVQRAPGHRTLRSGDSGPDVKQLQSDIIFWLQARSLDVDAAGAGFPEAGKFDDNTAALVKYAQRTLHLEPTGTVDPALWAALERKVQNYEANLLGMAENDFGNGNYQEAFNQFSVYTSKPTTPSGGALAQYRAGACLHNMGLFEQAAAEYGRALRMGGADDKVKGAAQANMDRATQFKEYLPNRGIDAAVLHQIQAEFDEIKKRDQK